jgi:uncharacterized protein YqeY
MNLKSKISEDLTTAMKTKDMTSLRVLRVLKAELERNEQTTNGRVELSDGQIIGLVKKFIDNVKETNNDVDEINVMSKYLPQQMDAPALRAEVLKLKEENQFSSKDMGKIMSHFKTNYEGRYDGKILSGIVKEVL